MMLRARACFRSSSFRSSCFAVVLSTLVTAAGCASSADRATQTAAVEAEQAKSAELGRRINACALQRQRIERAKTIRPRLERLHIAVERVAAISQGDDDLSKRERRGLRWSDDFDPNSIEDLQVVLDVDGLRIEATAPSWAVTAEFLKRINKVFVFEMSVAQAAVDEDGRVRFQLGQLTDLASSFEAAQFEETLFPPRKERSLEAYAADLCDFGEHHRPQVRGRVDGVSFEEREVRQRDGWAYHTVRARAPRLRLRSVLEGVADYDGVALEYDGDDVLVDLYRTTPTQGFDPSAWLEGLAREANQATEFSSESAPGEQLITWEEEEDFPAGVPRSALQGVSWYHYQRVHRLYHEIAFDHAFTSVGHAMRERRARALRASLCVMRAYSAPSADAPASRTRRMRAAKVDFVVPADDAAGALELERFVLRSDGHVAWKLSSPESEPITQAERAFARCMRAPDWASARSTQGERHQLEGTATAPSKGLIESDAQSIDIPRFEDGAAFIEAVRADLDGLRRKLHAVRTEQRGQDNVRKISQLLTPRGGDDQVLGELSELANQYRVDLDAFRQRPMSENPWKRLGPVLVELEASAAPADLLGFVAQLFDLERVLLPAELRITSENDRLRMKASVYSF